MFASSLAIVLGLGAFAFMWLFFASGMPFGAGYQPVPKKALRRMVELAEPKGKVVYDLGSGFGRVLFEAAAWGSMMCVGVEVDPLKCWWTRREARRKGLQQAVRVVKADLMDADLSCADVVFVFLTPRTMRKLEPKVLREMRAGAMVVSYDHAFKGWTPEVEDASSKVRLYRVPVISGNRPNS